MEPRISLSRAQINFVVASFYGRVRGDRVLGPIFAAHVSDWPTHEDKIANFWSNAILNTRNYDGNPMQAHIAAKNVRQEHFGHWLALFDQVLQQELPVEAARSWSHLAHRIGRGLSLGLAYNLGCKADIPNLGRS